MKPQYLICFLLLLLFMGACGPEIAPVSPTVVPSATIAPTLEPTATSIPILPVSLTRSEQSFRPARTFQIELGDLDDDGDLDAVFSNMGTNHSKVWLNDGSGHFEDSGQLLTEEGHGVGMEDLDGDGDLDLFITCASYEHRSAIYLNDGGVQGGTPGDFQNTDQDLGDYTQSGNAVRLHDVDGDGDLDAFVVYYQAPDKIYLNDGSGFFTDSGKTFPELSVLGDLDLDGDVDVFAKQMGVGYEVLLNDGDGNFVVYWQASDDDVLYGRVMLSDLDADGDLDAVIPNGDDDGSHPTHVFMNDGGVQGGTLGQFTDSGQELALTQWASVASGDLDGNGYPDLFITNFGSPDQVWLNDGTGYFINTDLYTGGNTTTSRLALGDLDSDGDLDVFVPDFGGGPNHVWFNEPSNESNSNE
ncbi:MAG: VCBS repeat-containing protein [Chloroflexi bacterium]|nr:VCBS repeat-containing protein [Chloroflexota bacterium]